jgi:hypothetical protein
MRRINIRKRIGAALLNLRAADRLVRSEIADALMDRHLRTAPVWSSAPEARTCDDGSLDQRS